MRIKICKDALIFVIHQFQIGGVESTFINLANKLTDREIYLLISYDSINIDFLKKIPIHVNVIKLNSRGGGLSLLLANLRLKLKYSFRNVSVINYSDTLSTLIVQRILNPKTKTTWIHCNPFSLLHSRSYKVYKYLFSKNDKIICLCDSQKKILSALMPGIKDKITIINNNVDGCSIKWLSASELFVSYKYIIMVSRFDCRTKDFKTLIDAYALLPPNLQSEFKLVLLGDGPDKTHIEKYVAQCNLAHNIIFPGKDANSFRWIRQSEFLVHSSLSEGFSLVLLEAMFLGKAVISSDCNCGPSDILASGKYGFLFSVGDVHTLKNIIENFLSDPILLRKYEALSLERAILLQSNSISQVKEFFSE